MRWILFTFLVIPLLTAQSALSQHLALFGLRPDWLLIFVVFVGLHASRKDAILAAWFLGWAADLMTIERCGLISMTYVFVTMAVVACRDYLFRDRVVTQCVATLLAGVAVNAVWLLYRRILYDSATPLWDEVFFGVFVAALYTAFWAPLIHGLLLKIRRPLGLTAPRFGYAP